MLGFSAVDEGVGLTRECEEALGVGAVEGVGDGEDDEALGSGDGDGDNDGDDEGDGDVP